MKQKGICALTAGLVIGLASTAFARDVYFNDVKLDSSVLLKDQTFANCEVRFDDKGNVHITVKGISVKLAPAAGDAGSARSVSDSGGAPGKVTQQYWLVVPQGNPAALQYEINVYLNGKWLKRLPAGDARGVVPLSARILPGKNDVRIVATKKIGDRRLSASPTDKVVLVIGEGSEGGGTVLISRPLVTYERNASESNNFSDDFSFQSR